MNMAGESLAIAVQREARHIDEKLFLETYAQPASAKTALDGGDETFTRPAGSQIRPQNCAGLSPIYGRMKPSASSVASPSAASRSWRSISLLPLLLGFRVCAVLKWGAICV
jgi:hypothetical protein